MKKQQKKKIPELLVPAGGYEQLKAAVANGADAVYLSGSSFNARINADNFTDETLKEAVDFAHRHGVRVHVTLNTLVREEEMEEAAAFAEKCRKIGADALILQDRGMSARLMKQMPDMTFHLSTQGTVYDSRGVQEAYRAGFQRIILSRELSLKEIKKICETAEAEIEIFVHGAICIAYSGQCHMSHVIGGRSGNRGTCAQPCRLTYDLVKDGEILSSPNGNCLLSPSDMCLIDHLSEIIDAGVASLKIEGRMKSPQYVATVTSIYRKYLDFAAEGAPQKLSEEDRRKLLSVFNRGGMTDAYFRGESGESLMSRRIPKHQGIYIGKVRSYDAGRGHVGAVLTESLSVGDGIEIRSGDQTCGNVVTYLNDRGNMLKTAPAGKKITIGDLKGKIRPDADIYRITDKALMKEAEETYRILPGRIPVRMKFTAKEGNPAHLKISAPLYRWRHSVDENDTDNLDITVYLQSEEILERAEKRPPQEENIRKQLAKTGGTPYSLSQCTVEIDGSPMIPASLLNALRRDGLELLTARRLKKMAREEAPERSVILSSEHGQKNFDTSASTDIWEEKNVISLYFYETEENRRKIADVYKEIRKNPDAFREKYIDFYLPYRMILSESDKILAEFSQEKDKPVVPDMRILAYLPAITKGFDEDRLRTDAEKLVRLYEQGKIHGVSAAHRGQLCLFENTPIPVIAEENFHIHNGESVAEVCAKGISRGVLSNELSDEDLRKIFSCEEIQKGEFLPEISVYGRIPVMYTEHCVIGAHKTGRQNCGKDSKKFYCKKGKYYLKDRKKEKFPIIADCSVCRMEILSHRPLLRDALLKELWTACRKSEKSLAARLYICDENPRDILRMAVRTAESMD